MKDERSFWRDRYRQQVAWSYDVRQNIYREIGALSDWRILEVGSGYGALLNAINNEGYRHTYGLDIDLGALRESEGGFPLICADGRRMPLAKGVFDACVCHFLLLWITNPDIALRKMAGVVRPGGWLIALAEPDYGGRIDHPPFFEAVGSKQSAALSAQGADILMGRQLPGLLQSVGLVNITCGVLPARWQPGAKQPEAEQEWLVLQKDLQEQMDTEELTELRDQEMEAWGEGNRVTYVPTFYGYGQVEG